MIVTGNDMVGAWKPGDSNKVIMIHPATGNDMVGAWKPGDSNKVIMRHPATGNDMWEHGSLATVIRLS